MEITFVPQEPGRLKLTRRHNGRRWTWLCFYTEAYANILCGSDPTWDGAVAKGLAVLPEKYRR